MNYYNPYINYPYTTGSTGLGGLFRRTFSNFSFSSILNGTQKTLNLINQTIPVVKQIGPVMKNAKTMFKVMNEFKKIDTPTPNKSNTVVKNEKKIEPIKNNGPTFFI